MNNGALGVQVRAAWEQVRSSLFWVPALYVVGAVGLSALAGTVDATGRASQVGWLFRADANTARSVLQTVAAAAITVAGLVFPVMVVALQLASSQFSPRVLRGFLRDRIFQHALAIVVATFTFATVMLASTPVQRGQRAEEPQGSVAVTLAVVLAVVAVLAIVAFIHHAARYMQVGEIIRRTTMETRERVAALLPEHEPGRAAGPDHLPAPPGHARSVRARHDGWVQQIDEDVLRQSLPPGATVRLDTRPGLFVVEQQALCTVWTADDRSDLDERIWEAFAVGPMRTMQQDLAFGIRQIVDIALRAMSPAINDPTTAYEVTVNLGAILRDILTRDLRPRVDQDDQGRTIIRAADLDHTDYVAHAFDQLRLVVARQPVAAVNLLGTIGTLVALLRDADLGARVAPLLDQCELVVAAVEEQGPLAHDLEKVRAAARAVSDAAAPARPLSGADR